MRLYKFGPYRINWSMSNAIRLLFLGTLCKDNWNVDDDGDGIPNIVGWDADGDGFSDGEEIAGGFDPGD